MLREPRQRNTVGCNTSGLGGWPVAPDVLLDRREELELFGIFGQHQNAWCMIVRIPREAGRRRGWDPRLPGLHVRCQALLLRYRWARLDPVCRVPDTSHGRTPPIDFMTGNHHAAGMATISLFLICPSSARADLAQPVTANLRLAARRADAARAQAQFWSSHIAKAKLLMCCSHRHEEPNSSASGAWKATAGQLQTHLRSAPSTHHRFTTETTHQN